MRATHGYDRAAETVRAVRRIVRYRRAIGYQVRRVDARADVRAIAVDRRAHETHDAVRRANTAAETAFVRIVRDERVDDEHRGIEATGQTGSVRIARDDGVVHAQNRAFADIGAAADVRGYRAIVEGNIGRDRNESVRVEAADRRVVAVCNLDILKGYVEAFAVDRKDAGRVLGVDDDSNLVLVVDLLAVDRNDSGVDRHGVLNRNRAVIGILVSGFDVADVVGVVVNTVIVLSHILRSDVVAVEVPVQVEFVIFARLVLKEVRQIEGNGATGGIAFRVVGARVELILVNIGIRRGGVIVVGEREVDFDRFAQGNPAVVRIDDVVERRYDNRRLLAAHDGELIDAEIDVESFDARSIVKIDADAVGVHGPVGGQEILIALVDRLRRRREIVLEVVVAVILIAEEVPVRILIELNVRTVDIRQVRRTVERILERHGRVEVGATRVLNAAVRENRILERHCRGIGRDGAVAGRVGNREVHAG